MESLGIEGLTNEEARVVTLPETNREFTPEGRILQGRTHLKYSPRCIPQCFPGANCKFQGWIGTIGVSEFEGKVLQNLTIKMIVSIQGCLGKGWKALINTLILFVFPWG